MKYQATIILLNSAGGHKKRTVAELPIIIRGMREKGYEFVTVPQLLSLPDDISLMGSASEGKRK